MSELSPSQPAGFWIRAVALSLDVIVFALVHVSLRALATLVGGPDRDALDSPHTSVPLFTLFFTALYTVALHTVAGQTIGKSLLGIRVVGMDGTPLGAGPAILRYLAAWLSAVPLGFGFLVAGLRADKRALHDLIAASRVEHVPARRRFERRPVAPRPPAVAPQEPAIRPEGSPGPGA